MRKAITSLQSCARLKTNSQILIDDVNEVTGIVPTRYLKAYFESCKNGNINKIMDFIEDLTVEGYSALQVIISIICFEKV